MKLKATIRLELISDDYFYALRNGSWSFEKLSRRARRLGPNRSPSYCAKIIDGRRFFQHGVRDYSHANSDGSRGIFEYFVLSNGTYEINSRISFDCAEKYYVRIVNETITRISRDEALCKTIKKS